MITTLLPQACPGIHDLDTRSKESAVDGNGTRAVRHTPSMTDTTGKRVARVKIAIAKRTVDALEPTGQAWIAWDDKLTGFVEYNLIPLI